jgi:hypothetical protein
LVIDGRLVSSAFPVSQRLLQLFTAAIDAARIRTVMKQKWNRSTHHATACFPAEKTTTSLDHGLVL